MTREQSTGREVFRLDGGFDRFDSKGSFGEKGTIEVLRVVESQTNGNLLQLGEGKQQAYGIKLEKTGILTDQSSRSRGINSREERLSIMLELSTERTRFDFGLLFDLSVRLDDGDDGETNEDHSEEDPGE